MLNITNTVVKSVLHLTLIALQQNKDTYLVNTMLANITTTNSTQSEKSLVAAYYSLILIIIGTPLNLLTFIVLCRVSFRDKQLQSIIHYMRSIAIFDCLMLYGWNLDHYLVTIQNFYLLEYSIFSCKFLCFLSYFTQQTSAWLRVFVCLYRYLSLSHYYREWMSRLKTVLLTIICIVTTLILFNSHILIFGCFRDVDGTINYQAQSYTIYPLWDHVNLGAYICLPFLCMTMLNSGTSYHLIRFHRTRSLSNLRHQHRAITFPLVVSTSMFLIMTTPATVAYAFFSDANVILLHHLDGLLYTHHVISFPYYLITLNDFRREFMTMLGKKVHHRRIAPLAVPNNNH